MATVVLSDVEALINRFYSANSPTVLSKPSSAAFKLIKKVENARGQYRLAQIYSDGGGRGATVAGAQSSTGPTSQVAFDLSYSNMARNHAVVRVDNGSILAAENNGTIVKFITSQGEAKMRKIVRSIQQEFYSGNGSRMIGQLTDETAGVMTFTYEYEVRRLNVGDVIVAAATETGAIRSGSGTVTAVNPAAKTVTYSGTITSVDNTDYVFMITDAANAGSVTGALGFPAWLPAAAPSSTLFYGVNRAVNTELLGGQRLDASGAGTNRDAISAFARRMFKNTQGDSGLNKMFVPVENFEALGKELQNQEVSDRKSANGVYGYSSLTARFGPYEIEIIPDPENNTGNGYGVDWETWQLASVGPVPHVDMMDGNKYLRLTDTAAIEMRIEAFYAIGCEAVGHSGVVLLPSTGVTL